MTDNDDTVFGAFDTLEGKIELLVAGMEGAPDPDELESVTDQ